MEYLTLVFATFGAVSLAAIIYIGAYKLTNRWDELFSGCIVLPIYMVSFFVIACGFMIFKKCTIDLIPSRAKAIIEKISSQNDSLKNEIAIYKGMAYDIKGADLEDNVFYITSNPKFYHYVSDCVGISSGTGKVKSERLEDAIGDGRISCSVCDAAKSSRYDVEKNDESPNVYICTGGTSKRYHCYRHCKGLTNCTGEIEKVSEEEAEDMGRTPCKICY